MKRRKFIQAAGTGVVIPTVLNGLPVNAYSSNSLLSSMVNPYTDTDHVMVLIYLGGGNDGLNTVVPIDQMSKLQSARTNVNLDENTLLKLNGQDKIKLHPSLTGFQTLFNEKKLSIVQSVGYPSPNFSHFRATDIWTSASDADQVIDTGWLGRYLNSEYPGFPIGYPNAKDTDPLAIQIGGNLPLLFQGPNAQMSMNVSNPDIFGAWPSGINDPAPANNYGKELSFVRTISRQSKTYADSLVSAFLKGSNQGTYPTGNYLADTLKIVARIIKGGLKTRLYLVSLYGFDTHADQVDASNTSTGSHANLLKSLGDAVLAFQRDLEQMKLDQRVLGMTFSEFGRRIKDNESKGTDHGAAAPLFLFGKNVQGGVIGNNPIIPTTATVDDNIPMQFDFRSVYMSVLHDWFCLSNQGAQDILLRSFQQLPLVNNVCNGVSVKDYSNEENSVSLIVNPNPIQSTATITVKVNNGSTAIQLFDPLGKLIKNIYRGRLSEGIHHFTIENENYANGNYYVRLQNGNVQKMELVIMIK